MLPKLPKEFQTTMLLTFDGRNTATEMLFLYDYYRSKAELIIYENGNQFRRIYYFQENEIILIKGK